MNILYCIDDAYLAQAAVSLSSVLKSNPVAHINVTIAGLGLEKGRAAGLFTPLLKRHPRCRIAIHDLNTEMFAGLPVTPRFSKSVYTRILLDRFMGPEVERVLYLDADTIVQADLLLLWEMDLKGKTIGAAPDHFRLENEVIGSADDEPYFNSGVIFFDMTAWRAKGYEQKVLNYLAREGHKLPWMDQDALNVILRGDVLFIDIGWNFQPRCADVPAVFLGLSKRQYDSLRSKPYIVHYTTSVKPWNLGYQVHYSDRFFHAVQQAGLGELFPKPRPADTRQRWDSLKTKLRWRFPRLFRIARTVLRPKSAALMYRAGAEG